MDNCPWVVIQVTLKATRTLILQCHTWVIHTHIIPLLLQKSASIDHLSEVHRDRHLFTMIHFLTMVITQLTHHLQPYHPRP